MIERPTRRLVLGTGLAGLTSGLARAATPHATSAAPVTLCALFPDSGAQALTGDEAWRGAALAVAEANRHRPQPVRLIRAGATDPAATIARLAKSDPPASFIGTLSSTRSFAATAAAELANIPYIELDAPADAITTRGFKTLLRTGLTTNTLAATTATAIVGQLAPAWHRPADALRIALLFDDGASNGAFAGAMLALARATKLPITLTLGYATDTMDLGPEASRMKRARIDLLIHAGRTEHVLLLYEALTGWRPRMIVGVGPGYGLSAIGFALRRAIENTMVIDAPLYAATGASATIAALYQQLFATPPRGSTSLTTYVGTDLVLRSLEPARQLAATLSATRLPRGALANGWGANFDATGQNRDSFATIQQWRAGRLVTIDPTIPGAMRPVSSL